MRDQGASWSREDPLQVPDSLCPHMVGGTRGLCGSFMRALMPFTKGSPPCLSTSPKLHFLIHRTRHSYFSIDLGEAQIFRPLQTWTRLISLM